MRQQPRCGVAHVKNDVAQVDLAARIPRPQGGAVADGDRPPITSSGWQRRWIMQLDVEVLSSPQRETTVRTRRVRNSTALSIRRVTIRP